MGKVCKYCGMQSDRDQVCTWCGKSLSEGATDPAAATAAEESQAPAAAHHPMVDSAPEVDSMGDEEGPEEIERLGPPVPGQGSAGPTGAKKKPGEAPSRYEGAARAMFEVERVRREVPAWRVYGISAAVLVALVVVAQVTAFVVATRPPAEPKDWKDYATQNNLFRMKGPGNWFYATSGSLGSFESARFKPGGLYVVSMKGTMVAGTVADIAGAASRLGASYGGTTESALPLERRKEGSTHLFLGDRAAKEDPTFKEEGQMQAMNVANLPAAWSYFTCTRRTGLMSVPMKGLRITMPATDLCYDLRVLAPVSHWDEFEKTAMQIINSLQQGTGK